MADDLTKKVTVTSASGTGATMPMTAPVAADAKTAPSDDAVDPYDDVKKEIRTRFELLPDDIKQAIMDDGYQMKLFELGKAQKLTYEELGTVEMETTMVLLGMTRPQDFRDELQLELKKNDAEIDTLVTAINEQVFAPIRASLDKVYAAKKDAENYIPPSVVTGNVPATTTPVVAPSATSASTPAKAPAPMPAAPQPIPGLTAAEMTTLEKTGVVISETPPMTKSAAPMTMPSRTDILKGIENPPKAPSAGLVFDKLKASAPVMPAAKVTDYSVVKPSAPTTPQAPTAPKPAGPDPYREQIN